MSEPIEDLDAQMSRYEGDFLESADLMQSPPVTVVIEKVTPPMVEKDAAKKPIKHPILDLKGAKKRFVTGKTNERLIKAIHGKKASGWIGKSITLCVRYLPEAFGEKNVPTLRVQLPPGVAMPMQCRKFYGEEKPRN